MEIYTAAIECAVNDDLRDEWGKDLSETRTHRAVLTTVFSELRLDPEKMTSSRDVVAHHGRSLVKAIQTARANHTPAAAQIAWRNASCSPKTRITRADN